VCVCMDVTDGVQVKVPVRVCRHEEVNVFDLLEDVVARSDGVTGLVQLGLGLKLGVAV